MASDNNSAIAPSPSTEEKLEADSTLPAIKNTKYYETIHSYQATAIQESHQNRLKLLRKELDYLQETEWMYQPIEKYIGQSTQQH